MKEYKFHEYSYLFPMIEGKEFEELKQDIKQNGLIEPIWLYEEQIIDGRNRYNSCKETGIEPRFQPYEGKNIVQFIISLNQKRRHLTKQQWACVGVDALPMFEKEAEKRMKSGTNQYSPSVTIREGETGKSSEITAKNFNVGSRYIEFAKQIKQELPEKFEEIKAGKTKLTQVIREMKKEKQLETIKSEDFKPPEGKFNVIVIDPPWQYGGYDPDGLRGQGDYPTMTIEQLKEIKLPTADDCVLWLWGVDLLLKETLDLIEYWGFERKSTLIWDKQIIGLGHWLRNQHEYCFLCVKGKPVFHGESTSSILNAKRLKHSEKPQEFYDLVEKTSPYKDKLDYFARKKRKGWIVFGDEVNE